MTTVQLLGLLLAASLSCNAGLATGWSATRWLPLPTAIGYGAGLAFTLMTLYFTALNAYH